MDARRRRLRDQRPSLRAGLSSRAAPRPPSSATTCRSPGGTATHRYGEKLATPDTSVGDLVGDVDPTKVAEGRTLGDPETVHYGLLPRANRGIFGINELPDLAERIQVALFNVLEERDIQVRGYALRLPLDLLLVASANPEDYTNRGRIITPLKDRFGAEIRTHYPLDIADEIALIAQEADLVAEVPEPPGRGRRAVHRRAARVVGGRPALRRLGTVRGRRRRRHRRRGPAPRCAASARRTPVARVGDLAGVLVTLRGKVEFEMGEEGREDEVFAHLFRLAIAATYRERLAGVDLTASPSTSSRATRSRPVRSSRPPTCSPSSAPSPGSRRCSTPSASARTTSLRARSPQRSSSCSKACT